jgi:multiple sugar transport system substrate-binding protein
MQYNWPHLYQNAVVDVSDVAGARQGEGGFYEIWSRRARSSGKWLSVPHSIVGNAVAYRTSWLKEAGATQYPKTWDEARKLFARLKKKGKPYGQTSATPSATPALHLHACCGPSAAPRPDKSGKKVVLNSKGAVESVKFMQAFWKECCDEGGLAWDDTNNNRAFHAGEICATLNGATHLHRGQAAEGQDQGRQGRADVARTSTTRRCRLAPPARTCCS